MVGDSSDNIPGVEGIGPKTAPKLLGEYGNIEGAVANAMNIRNKRVRESLGSERGAATAHLCRSLVKIRTALSDPTINEPALPIDALGLTGKVPPADGGKGVGEYLERELEIASAADRWRRRATRRRGVKTIVCRRVDLISAIPRASTARWKSRAPTADVAGRAAEFSSV